MSTTATIDRQKNAALTALRRTAAATRKVVGPISRISAARREEAALIAAEDAILSHPSLAAAAAALDGHRFCLRLFAIGLAVLIVGELVFVMPPLIAAIGAISGGFGDTSWFRILGSIVILASLTVAVIMLKRTLPPLCSNLRDSFDVDIREPNDPADIETAFQRRRVARRNTLLNLSMMALYLATVAWVMKHNLSAGRLFIDRLDALEAATAVPAQPTLGDSLFASVPPVSAPAATVSKKQNPQTAILGLFLITHTALLIIPIDWRQAAQWHQLLATHGVNHTLSTLQRRKALLRNRINRNVATVQRVIADHSRDPESRLRIEQQIRDLIDHADQLAAPAAASVETFPIHRATPSESVPVSRNTRFQRT